MIDRASNINWVPVAATVTDLHQRGDSKHFNLIRKTYVVETKGRLHKLKWVWDGRCRCISEQTGIVDNLRHCAGQNGAAKNALRDYFTEAGQLGLYTQEQLSQLEY